MKTLKHRKYLHDPEGSRLPVKLDQTPHSRPTGQRPGGSFSSLRVWIAEVHPNQRS